MAELTHKQFLDQRGLATLWDRIKQTFAPRWSSYKPSNTQTQHSGTNIESETVNAVAAASEVLIINTAAGQLRDGSGNLVSGKDIIVHIPSAVGGTSTSAKAGVMSAADKLKLDNLESTAENSVTLKKIMVGGGDSNATPQALKISTQTNSAAADYKSVAFGLKYDAATDLLSILDLNDANKTALSSVHILGDALKHAFIKSVTVTDKDQNNVAGTFLKIVFSTITQDDSIQGSIGSNQDQTVYVNISDLIDTYSGGNGITITNTAVDPDDTNPKTATISLNRAGVGTGADKIGGVKVYKDLGASGAAVAAKTSSQTFATTGTTKNDNRFLGVELDKNGQAYVYNPVETAEVATATTANGGTLAHSGEFTAITGVGVEVDDYTGKITIAQTPTKFKLPAETTLSKGTDKTNAPTVNPLKFGSSFTAMVDTKVNNHTVTDVNTTWTLPSLSVAAAPGNLNYGNAKSNTQIVAAPVNTTTPPEPHISIPVITNIGLSVTDSGAITLATTQEKYDYWVNVESIPTADIQVLTYPLS